ncbi:unnamed protein product [Didymodactylos carnosus]|uniref:Uncharacterized protein n=1 Tax=Didymodactylos carnosus TaxID=1234261 RepID=A0A814BSA0_9BILA|nr:unnamed protein product [Didymodactylos carnosus]CAF0933320.1 unnamed protein product [Didymodactylos carnosus]CAF3590898.1 unnamed protein product [Didymodactylos carnosus]CAF3710951.1 unnamed protein product [Didymodactylos carnosus]
MGQVEEIKKLTSSRSLSANVNAKWYLQRLRTPARNTDSHSNHRTYLSRLTNDSSQEILTIIDPSKSVTRPLTSKNHAQSAKTKTVNILPSKQPIPDHYVSQSKVIPSPRNERSTNSLKIIDTSSLKDLSSQRLLSLTNSLRSSRVSSAIPPTRITSAQPDRKSSTETLNSVPLRPVFETRPPSTPIDARCDRSNSSSANILSREACNLLGPKLCSDCTEIKVRSAHERQSTPLTKSHLYALAIQRYLVNVNENDVEKLINEKKVNMNPLRISVQENAMISDDEYFNQLASSFNTHTVTPYYFRDMSDFAEKYRQNKYDRSLLSESKVPQSANPIFDEQIEKYDIANNYKTMRRASTVKPNLVSMAPVFISPKKSQRAYQERYFMNYSPPLLLNALQNTARLNSNPNVFTIGDDMQTIQHKSLIATRYMVQV